MKKIITFLAASAMLTLSTTGATASGQLLKSSGSGVYFSDGAKRYVFPTESVYKSWYKDFSSIQNADDVQLALLPFGGSVTMKPGSLIKIQTDPKVYAISRYGVLHWITSEALAQQFYGDSWNKSVVDMPEAFFADYKRGFDITATNQYSRLTESFLPDPAENIRPTGFVVETKLPDGSKPMIVITDLPAMNQISMNIYAATSSTGATVVVDGKTMDASALALCPLQSCSLTVQINEPGYITAFSPVGMGYATSNTIVVRPD
ncbi:MAG: hypothetical protein RDU25_00675 [Patescibacteria group bacterium]|nr:hypothetical protein [Patescibacteria group bacterium]